MTIERKIQINFYLLHGFCLLGVLLMGIGYIESRQLHNCHWFTWSGALGGILALFAQQRYAAALQLINPDSAFAAEGQNERRKKYLARFLHPISKHGFWLIGIAGTLVCAFGDLVCS